MSHIERDGCGDWTRPGELSGCHTPEAARADRLRLASCQHLARTGIRRSQWPSTYHHLAYPRRSRRQGPLTHHRLRSQKQTYLAQTRNSPSRPAILLTALSVPRCLSFPQPLDNASCSSLILQPTFALPGHFQPGSGFHLRRPISLPKSPRSAHLLTGPGQHGPLPASYNGPYPPARTP